MQLKWIAGSAAAFLGLATSIAAGHAEGAKIKVAEAVRAHLYVPMYIAMTKGYTKEEGLDVDLITANGNDRMGPMLLTGQIDVGLSGPQTAIFIYNSESLDKPLVFATLAGTDGLYLASRQKLDHFEWSMLIGKKLLGSPPASTPQMSLEYVMKQKGLPPETIKQVITNVATPNTTAAWLSGVGDFVIQAEPSATKLELDGKLHIVASMGKELGRADYSTFYAKKSWLDSHRDVAQKWTNAMARGQAWTKTATTPEIAEAVAPFFPGLTQAENVAIIARFREYGAPIWAETPEVDRDGLAKFQTVMVTAGTLPADKVLPYETIVAADFARQAMQKAAPK
jgi:NitT/TauT family transport system substrate-binding protein